MVHGLISIPLSDRSRGVADGLNGKANGHAHLDEFVAGPENRLAVTAIRALLDGQAQTYSPVVFYGTSGTGKSHVAAGLIDWCQAHRPNLKAVYFSGADFARQYADAVDRQQLTEWREVCRSSDLFVLDELAGLAGKRGAQQELRHTLDALRDRDSVVVMTSQALPMHSRQLSPGLRSRVSAGLSVPLLPHALQARRAIIERIAKARGMNLPVRVIDRLAEKPDLTIPAIVGALMQIEMAEIVENGHASGEQVAELARQQHKPERPSLREITQLAARHFGLKMAELRGPLRRRAIVNGRYVAMYLARELAGKSLQQIGAYFGGRDHTTVLHGCRRTEKLMKRDVPTRHAVAEIRRMLVMR